MSSQFADLGRAAFDLRLYGQAITQKRRRTIGFLALVSLVAAMATTVSWSVGLSRLVNRVLPIVDQIPTIVIRDGTASTDVPQPWVRHLADSGDKDVVLIVDTTGKLTDFSSDQIGLFLTKTALLVKGDEGETQSVSLTTVPDLRVGPDVVRMWIARARFAVPPLLAAVLFLLYLSIKTTQALLFVLVGLAAASGRKHPLPFRALFAISVYAMAPAVLVDCVLKLLPFWFLQTIPIYFAIVAFYTFVAIRRLPDEPI